MNVPTKIDCHVHIVGNGSSGSGCWIRRRGIRTLQARFMLAYFGIPQSALLGDLDRLYVERLVELVKESSLDKAVILANDYVYDDQGRRIENFSTFYVPNDYVLSVAREHEEFLAAVSIHPVRPDALDELERAIEGGAVMLKILPNCQNINCGDKRLVPFWERMAKAGIVLLAHTGGELSVPVYEPSYATPEILTLPLECGVTVIAAHSGTSSYVLDKSYTSVFESMLERYPNLYGDNSALNTPFRARHLRWCKDLSSRIVHGSDLPIFVSSTGALLWQQIGLRECVSLGRCTNAIEKDCQIKRAIGFPDETFTRLSGLLC